MIWTCKLHTWSSYHIQFCERAPTPNLLCWMFCIRSKFNQNMCQSRMFRPAMFWKLETSYIQTRCQSSHAKHLEIQFGPHTYFACWSEPLIVLSAARTWVLQLCSTGCTCCQLTQWQIQARHFNHLVQSAILGHIKWETLAVERAIKYHLWLLSSQLEKSQGIMRMNVLLLLKQMWAAYQ